MNTLFKILLYKKMLHSTMYIGFQVMRAHNKEYLYSLCLLYLSQNLNLIKMLMYTLNVITCFFICRFLQFIETYLTIWHTQVKQPPLFDNQYMQSCRTWVSKEKDLTKENTREFLLSYFSFEISNQNIVLYKKK